MDPEDVRGHNLDAAGLHLEQFFAPLTFGVTREMKFAHRRRPSFAVPQKTLAVDEQGGAIRPVRFAHLETVGDCGWRFGDDNHLTVPGNRGRREDDAASQEQKSPWIKSRHTQQHYDLGWFR